MEDDEDARACRLSLEAGILKLHTTIAMYVVHLAGPAGKGDAIYNNSRMNENPIIVVGKSGLGFSAKARQRYSYRPGKHLPQDRSPTTGTNLDHAMKFAWNG
jgi:hypothetical protein